MTFLRQRALETELNKSTCDSDRHARAAMIDKILMACGMGYNAITKPFVYYALG